MQNLLKNLILDTYESNVFSGGKLVLFASNLRFFRRNNAQETPIQTRMGLFQNSSLEAWRCNNICHRARFRRFKIEKHMRLSGLTVHGSFWDISCRLVVAIFLYLL
jgi:hypothetical protein